MLTKHELDAQLASLAALQTKTQTMAFTDEEKEQLAELLREARATELREWRRMRVRLAVDVLFPTWRGGRIEKPGHPAWHEKSWWWNGARVKSEEVTEAGDVIVRLSSYVGGGETDEIDELTLKRAWLEADDMPAVIQSYMLAEAARLEAERLAGERARAQAELAAAQAKLASLANGAE